MSSKRLVRIAFSQMMVVGRGGMHKDLLTELLSKLPGDAKFIGAGQDTMTATFHLIFESSTFDEVREGDMIPEAIAYFSKDPMSGFEMCDRIEYPRQRKTVANFWGQTGCVTHVWQTYQGLNTSETVCSICGVKQ